LEGQAYH